MTPAEVAPVIGGSLLDLEKSIWLCIFLSYDAVQECTDQMEGKRNDSP